MPVDIHQATRSSLSKISTYLCTQATQSEGVTLAIRVCVEILTPGLRHFNAMFKDTLRMARTSRASEVEAHLGTFPEFHHLLGVICNDLQTLHEHEWWQSIVEVADCGAQREVLTRLIHKQLKSSPKAQELRSSWRKEFLKQGGIEVLIERLTQKQGPTAQLVIAEITREALGCLSIPSVSAEEQDQWVISQTRFIEAAQSQSWGEARDFLKTLAGIAPRSADVLLYWSLLKCANGQVVEALNGVERASEMNPSLSYLKKLAGDVKLWRRALEAESAQADEAEDHVAETQFGQPTQAQVGIKKPSQVDYPLQKQDWSIPTGLLQAIADLGSERLTEVSIAGLLGQLYHQLNEQRALSVDALRRYPEAHPLLVLQRRLKSSLALVERGLGIYQVDPQAPPPPVTLGVMHSGVTAFTRAQRDELMSIGRQHLGSLRSGSDEEPPPLPMSQEEGIAPTAMINMVDSHISVSVTPPPQSLTVDIEAPLDFTLEPEITDLARAEALMKRGEFTQAEHCLLALLDQNPFDAFVHNDLGVLYFQTQRFGDAKAHLMLAIECHPQYEEAWSNLVELFASLGHLHHVLPFFKRFEMLVESSPDLRRLHKLCERFAPEGVAALPPPRYADTVGLKLPLSGSFFVMPSTEEEIQDSISAPLSPEWDAEENARIKEERVRSQEEMAVQRRVEVSALLDAYTRATQPLNPSTDQTLIGWLKNKMGFKSTDRSQVEEVPAPDDLDALYDLREEVLPPPPKPLPEDLHRVRNIAFSMLCVPAGSFKMGTDINSPFGCANETPQHIVVISRPFQLARVPVTQELYQAVMLRNPSQNRAPGHPVVRVSWIDAIRFCNTLSELEGLPLVYTIAGGPRPEVAIHPTAAGYRLPTEAEWEYCARGRQPFRYSGSEQIYQVGWSQTDKIQTVARKDPNGWGFYDMSGNVWEWCNDGMREYDGSSQVDPKGEAHPYMHTPSARVIRGGSWCFEEDGSRVAFRGRGALGLRISSLGFRIARSL